MEKSSVNTTAETTYSVRYLYPSETERYMWMAWCILTLVICILGNILIIVSTLKYTAIKLDKITVVLIQNIAVADLGCAVFRIIPKLSSLRYLEK